MIHPDNTVNMPGWSAPSTARGGRGNGGRRAGCPVGLACRVLLAVGLSTWAFGCREDKPVAGPATRSAAAQTTSAPSPMTDHQPVAAYTQLRERIFAVRPADLG